MSNGRDFNRRGHGLVGRGAVAAMLAGPTALAFFAGGYFAGPRLAATVVAWALAGTGVLIARPDSNARAPGGRRLAVVALGLFTAWTFLSATWAPIPGRAVQRGEIALLYSGALLAATALLQTRERLRSIEPALAAGALFVILYGLSERFLPGLLHFASTSYSQGRLEQPLTYWNAEGEVAAIGLVLCAASPAIQVGSGAFAWRPLPRAHPWEWLFTCPCPAERCLPPSPAWRRWSSSRRTGSS